MGISELLLIAVGLSMDAFAVAVCKGLSMEKATLRKAALVGMYFGVFQCAMPLAGYFLAAYFADKITAYDHWIAFVLLSIIGGKMVWESFRKQEESGTQAQASLSPRAMLPLALATSIDAMAVGVSFAFLKVEIFSSSALIGVTTFLLSMLGVKLGHVAGAKLQNKAELAGGIILILIGIKIVLEHLEIIHF